MLVLLGIVVAGSNHQHLTQKLKNEVARQDYWDWYFKDDRVGKIKLKEGLPKTLDGRYINLMGKLR